MHFIEKFDKENIDEQHLRPPVLPIQYRYYWKLWKGKILTNCYLSGKSVNIFLIKKCAILVHTFISGCIGLKDTGIATYYCESLHQDADSELQGLEEAKHNH